MKKNDIFKFLAGACALFLLVSCNYEEWNTNPYEMTDEMSKMDGIAVGSSITAMERFVFPVGTSASSTDVINQYQIAYNLSADCWSGYFAQDKTWDGGYDNTCYFLKDDWISATYKNSYTEVFPSWQKVKIESEKVGMPEAFALAQILKVSAWHKTLESFGPIPYIHAGEAALVIPFDSEEEVYKAMFEDLKAAIAVLVPLAESGSAVVPDFDAVYAGSARAWVKYANSLMLRLAMRLRFIAPEMSKQWVTEALGHSMGVMTSQADEAKMAPGAVGDYINNIQYLSAQYNDCRISTSLYVYLNGYRDPRLAKYYTTSDVPEALTAYDGKKYAPLPPGMTTEDKTHTGFSLPVMVPATPTYWMRASEVYFLRAEAALAWPEFGNPEDFYKAGVEMSFLENGLDAAAAATYVTTDGAPCEISIVGYTQNAPTGATPKFEGSDEEKLEKIMIQKWIALFPNGQEAWTEWRRTGYPVLNEVMVNNGAADGVTKEKGIRRMKYPISFYASPEDKANYEDAVSKLKDKADTPVSRLWWDVKVK